MTLNPSPTLWDLAVEGADFEARQADRRAWFDLIAPAGNWKLPIDAVISHSAFAQCDRACVHFTGSRLTVAETFANGTVRVTAPGYYATIGA